eukprot:CAMPEP_0114371084 /NCGR_PEP_ID=MMETSP0101-20121206/33024_1 /TAXON_ID=38822 ORGANISM="Pteridomonas danica, Strain PT" /NCGR_SAMPLE_ID=MMETSP0101 /ASSEMBLY_ACC=CAM_ASM_000211 /LENGTH=415 /DNA_ID=CAMNT_0001522995 /DNA_START=13 /DNA_END=1260 /DNA_ORIENTATION=-
MASLVVDDDSKAPPSLELPEIPLSLDFHPTLNVLASGLVDGGIYLNQYNFEEHSPATIHIHPFREGTGGCRVVRFSKDGQSLFAGSADHSIIALSTTGQVVWNQPDAHRDPVSCLTVIDDNMIASGDDSGAVKIWDIRQSDRPAMSFDVFQDYVSDCVNDQESHPECLLATSGDGSLGCFDMKQQKLIGRSDELEEDILSVQIIKRGRKVVCGTNEGTILIFSWGYWSGGSDSFPGHPESVGAILKLNEETILTGSSDGFIRVVGIQPSKLYGLVGDHEGFPLEKMRWSNDKNLIGSISHDNLVRFWDVSYLHEDDDDEEEDDDDEEEGEKAEDDESNFVDQTSDEILQHIRKQRTENGDDDSEDDWEDDDGDDGDMADSDSDSDSGGNGGAGGGGGGHSQTQFKTQAENFFQDL